MMSYFYDDFSSVYFYFKKTNLKTSLTISVKNLKYRGAWLTSSVKHPTLDLGSGHDLRS